MSKGGGRVIKIRQSKEVLQLQYISNFILIYLYIPTIFQPKHKTKNTMVEVKIFNPS